ncbi:MAG: ABC transporter permease [Planctomycetota bacterium]|jgi:ribose transport system permease protein|nr:ABC transporter permease [Planctomycetota bacterium]
MKSVAGPEGRLKRALAVVPVDIYAIVLLGAIFWAACDPGTFLTSGNFMNIMEQCTILAVISIASLLPIITKGVDLSLGSIMSFAGVVAAYLVRNQEWGMAPACLAAVAAGAGVGMINGFIISRNNVAPFIITLGTMNIAKSLAMVVSNSRTISANTPSFRWLGGETVGGVPYSVALMLAVYLVFDALMRKRRLGGYIYAIGGNETAARLSGIDVRLVKFLTYTFGGVLAAVAGVMLASRLGSANPGYGDGFEFYGIASAVVGGASMAGGTGSVWRMFAGSFIISALRNGLNMAGLPVSLQMIVLGLIIVGIVTLDTMGGRGEK